MERLQKVLAQAGIASRRAAEQIILAGRVRVDGKIVRELGTQVDPRTSRVEVDGNKIVAEKLIYIVLHKPRGVVCTLSDPEGRPTILELLKDTGARVVPVGRLDFHTSGALLCTNDGEFAQALAHPKKAVPKVYVAKVQGVVDDEALERFSERIVIDGRPTQPAQVKVLRLEGDKTWLEITLREGRNRQVRRLGEATGFPVMRLARISHAGVTSEDLRPGQWRPLSVDELVELKRDYGVPKKVHAPIFQPALGKGGWSDEPRMPGVRRPEPKFSAARRRDAKPRDAKRSDVRQREPKSFEAARSEPARFERKRAPSRAEAPRAEAARFERKRAPSRAEAPRAEAARFERKRAPSRAEAARSEPARFERKRAPSHEAPDAKRGRSAARETSFRSEREQGPSRKNPKRPWEAQARAVTEGRPFNKRGGDPVQDRATPYAKRAGARDQYRAEPPRAPALAPSAKPFNAAHREKKRFNAKNAEPKVLEPKRPRAPSTKAPFDAKGAARSNSPARSDARASGPRRGTSR